MPQPTKRMFPVVEVFGPTIQGEGPDAGRPCLFIRFGGCDYRCTWCDSMHAVLPDLVRLAPRLTSMEIIERVVCIALPPFTVVISGGNPALHDLSGLVDGLMQRGYRVTVETQGTIHKPWLDTVDLVVVSPKPPSSGMTTNWTRLDTFLSGQALRSTVVKVVVGSDADYAYARAIRDRYWAFPMYVSVLNPAGSDASRFEIGGILENYRALCERVAADSLMHDVHVLPQLHTLAWGAQMGV